MGPNKKPSFKNKKRKVNLVFDEEKRRDFLTGFHKRKMQRKKQAQEKFERELADERKKLKREAKESYKKLVVSSRPIVGLEHLLEEEYGDDDVTVKITEITDEDIAKKCTTIGANKFKSDESNEEEIEEEDDEVEEDEVPGMELKPSKVSKNDAVKEEETTFSSQKDIKKTLKKMATKNVKKSAVFQMKNDMERRKQKKKALKKKRENMKVKKKMFKKSHKKGSNK